MNKFLSTFGLLLLPILSFAHGSHGSGFMAGFTHPIFGLDHNLAIAGIGILGYVIDKEKWYLHSLAFIITMIIGGALGIGQGASSAIEIIIVLSVLIIGGILGFNITPNKTLVFGLIAFFGFVHGYAHGAEMPETTTAFKFISGYVVGGMLLSILGWIIGKLIDSKIAALQYQILIGGILIGSALMMFLG